MDERTVSVELWACVGEEGEGGGDDVGCGFAF